MNDPSFSITPEVGGGMFTATHNSRAGLNMPRWAKITGSAGAGPVRHSWEEQQQQGLGFVKADAGINAAVDFNPAIDPNGQTIAAGTFVRVQRGYYDPVFDWVYYILDRGGTGGGGGGGTPLTVREVDGAPSIANVSVIEVPNFSLQDIGGGVARLLNASITTAGVVNLGELTLPSTNPQNLGYFSKAFNGSVIIQPFRNSGAFGAGPTVSPFFRGSTGNDVVTATGARNFRIGPDQGVTPIPPANGAIVFGVTTGFFTNNITSFLDPEALVFGLYAVTLTGMPNNTARYAIYRDEAGVTMRRDGVDAVVTNANLTIRGGIVVQAASGAGGGGDLTVRQSDGTNSVPNVTIIEFDIDDLEVMMVAPGIARIRTRGFTGTRILCEGDGQLHTYVWLRGLLKTAS